MKIFGHPVHLMLIHFPSALFPLEWITFVALFLTDEIMLAHFSLYLLCAGCLTGWMAVVFGALDVAKISPDKPGVLRHALLHGGVNSTILIVYTVIAFRAYTQFPGTEMATWAMVILKGILVCGLMVGNYWGGNLVLKYKVGVHHP